MAGFENLKPNENQYINKWLLELACYASHRDFINSGTVDNATKRNFVQGVLYKVEGHISNKESVKFVHILRLLCLLADGKDPGTSYEDEEDMEGTEKLTTLEHALHEYKAIISRAPRRDMTFSEDVLGFERDIKQQAVCTCCRNNCFDDARAVYERIWKPVEHDSEENKVFCKKMKRLIKSEQTEGDILDEYTYESFVEKGKAALTEIMEQFQEPFIISAARRVAGKVKPIESPVHKRGKLQPKAQSTAIKSSPPQTVKNTGQENGLDNTAKERLENKLDMIVDEKTFNQLSSRLCVKHVQLDNEKKTHLQRRLDRVRNRKEKYEVGLYENLFGDSKYASTTKELDFVNIRKRLGLESREDISSKKTKSDFNDGKGDNIEALSSTDSDSPKPFKVKESLRDHKLRRNLNRQDRHRMPDLELSDSDPAELSDLDMTPLPKLNETVIDTLGRRSVKKKKRTYREMWTDKEEKTFFQGVMEIGQGNWAEIKTWGDFHKRTSVNLKDKWRTICKQHGRLKELRLWYNSSGGFGTPERNGLIDSD